MAYIADDVYRAALAVLAGSDCLHVARQEVTTASELGQCSLGMSPVRLIQSGKSLSVLPVKGAAVTNSGRASHWVLVRSGQVLASSALDDSKALVVGNDFDLPGFDITFP